MHKTNEYWLSGLRSTGAAQQEALAALRGILLARLRAAFQGRTGVDDALLEDATQDALLKALDNLDGFQGKSRFTTWATTIAVHAAYTELRRRRWKDVSLDRLIDNPSSAAHEIGDAGPRPDAATHHAALVEQLYRCIASELTEKQRTALLAELKGMPLEEIGRRMGSNRNAIYKLTHDARKRLKRSLEAAGYSAADLQPA